MKLKKLFLGSLIVGLMASCSDDLQLNEVDKVLENRTTTYVRLSIGGDMGGSRAGEDAGDNAVDDFVVPTPKPEGGKDETGYEYGTADESRVYSVLLTFFDQGRNYVGKSEVRIDKGTMQEVGNSNTVESKLTYVATVNLPEGISYPKYVIAYVNPTRAKDDLGTEKLEDAMRFIRVREDVSHELGRTMNNSVYFDKTTGNTRFATEVDFETHFFSSVDDAKKEGAATIDITVERMEAKVRLNSINEIEVKDFETNKEVSSESEVAKYKLKFVPEAWFVNATEKRSFLLKNYRTIRENYTTSMTVTNYGFKLKDLNDVFTGAGQTPNPGFTVNDFTNKRSFWAIDPTYFSSDVEGPVYPDVSYDIAYTGTDNESVWKDSNDDWGLLYRSYNDAVNEYKAGTTTNYMNFVGNTGSRRKTHEYVLENTMSHNTVRGTSAKASMTSVVVLGHYIITDKSNKEVFNGSVTDPNKGFYISHEADGHKYVMLTDNEAMDYFLERNGSLLYTRARNQDGTLIEDEFLPIHAALLEENRKPGNASYGLSRADFTLSYPKNPGTILSEQWRTLEVVRNAENNKYNDNIYIYDYNMKEGKGGYKKLNEVALSDTEFKSFIDRLNSNLGTIEKFQSGKAYFNVPIKHIWGDLSNASNKFEPDKVCIGDYGVVRNHIYDMTINSISGLGTGIGDINQPIVPPTENEQYYVSTRLNILKWRVVSQKVNL